VEKEDAMESGKRDAERPLGIVVVGASGNLARHKVIPALFALYCQGYLPRDFHVFGLARSAYDTGAFRSFLAENLGCRYAPGASCADRAAEFLERCHYHQGQYSDVNSYLDLFELMRRVEGRRPVDRMFYLAIPPSVFSEVARALGDSGLVACGSRDEWSRVVVEKPFGRDRASSDALVAGMHKVFAEDSTYRIDHYLGKEVVQNLMVLRFANLVFEPLWSREWIESVHVKWAEPVGVEGRGGYFDDYGIIRDVMQNHLLQIVALLAMERPARLGAAAVRDEKVKLLRAIMPVAPEDLVVGQYGRSENGRQPAYVEDPSVPRESRCPTYAAVRLHVRNPRWEGIPFLVEAGKALDTRVNEVRIRFRRPSVDLFGGGTDGEPNELVIRIQPDEAITLRITSKAPGLDMRLARTELNLQYKAAFATMIPDAYECLLLDVMEGDRRLFIREDELAAAWDIFTPALRALGDSGIHPDPYPYGSRGPERARELFAAAGLE
jgi:glucose-6-phosphate 1-dehydrogenase